MRFSSLETAVGVLDLVDVIPCWWCVEERVGDASVGQRVVVQTGAARASTPAPRNSSQTLALWFLPIASHASITLRLLDYLIIMIIYNDRPLDLLGLLIFLQGMAENLCRYLFRMQAFYHQRPVCSPPGYEWPSSHPPIIQIISQLLRIWGANLPQLIV